MMTARTYRRDRLDRYMSLGHALRDPIIAQGFGSASRMATVMQSQPQGRDSPRVFVAHDVPAAIRAMQDRRHREPVRDDRPGLENALTRCVPAAARPGGGAPGGLNPAAPGRISGPRRVAAKRSP
jgi:hypothetical protein